jgi:2-polyprenyl-3-methyl-5-hydroxy-6-metoxy-1,4-benzoquinol methylase
MNPCQPQVPPNRQTMNKSLERIEEHSFEEVRVCDLCDNDTFDQEFTAHGFTLLRCSACGLVFTSPRYSEDYLIQMYKDQYYENAPSYLSSQLQQPAEDLYRLAVSIKKMLPRTQGAGALRALDVGCGAGNAVAAFRSAGWEAVGIDLNETAIGAGKDVGLNLRAMDIAEIEPRSFDVVTVFHVLEHISSPKTFLSRCASCLVPQGILLLDVPNYGSRNSRRLREHWPNLYPRLHLYQFTAETLKAYLTRLNLEELSMKKVSGYGPAEDYTTVPGAHLRPRSRLKKTLQESRHVLYLMPGGKPFLRWLFWQALGYGEFLRVLCRKNW